MIESRKEKIKASIFFIIISIIILLSGIIFLKYQLEGENNLPFKLSKIYIISSAEGIENSNSEEKWNFNIHQNNDIYFDIVKNEDFVDEKIQSVKIANIKITKKPVKGNINVFMPNSSEGRKFTNSEESILEGDSLTYVGGLKTDIKTLNIGNQGGQIVIRFTNNDLGSYISNEDEEIKHDGTMLGKIEINNEDIKFEVSFDVIISVKNKSYKASMNFELPLGNIIENGTENIEVTNMDKYVFKRM